MVPGDSPQCLEQMLPAVAEETGFFLFRLDICADLYHPLWAAALCRKPLRKVITLAQLFILLNGTTKSVAWKAVISSVFHNRLDTSLNFILSFSTSWEPAWLGLTGDVNTLQWGFTSHSVHPPPFFREKYLAPTSPLWLWLPSDWSYLVAQNWCLWQNVT